MDFLRTLAITIGMPIHKDRLRTKFRRRPQWHRGMHAESARFIGRRRNHPALMPLPSHHDWLAFQGRIKQFFHRDEKRVHVNVEDSFKESNHESGAT